MSHGLSNIKPKFEDVFKNVLKNESIASFLGQKHFKQSFDKHDSIYTKNFKNQVKHDKKFNDLGGLKDVKEKLRQIVHWPTKYPELFKNCPIQPQKCILLYGLPGTGKTSLAEALANEFKINLISIKGPEILSKYIGASEQAIRELFEKAYTSKPCIIFFDEIDSLTPSRGNDNTAVTDRIINQLLTQMDGIETLKEGIYILASTSRPDMIDSALLRPGRFDLCIECKLPNEFERTEILKNLSDSFAVEEGIDLSEIALKTENFTGSDLNALFINTQNEAVNEIIKLNDDLEIENEEEFKENLIKLKLNIKHFKKALTYTFPSLDKYERERYLKTLHEVVGLSIELNFSQTDFLKPGGDLCICHGEESLSSSDNIVVMKQLMIITFIKSDESIPIITAGDNPIVMDLAPAYSGSLYGLTNAIASIPGFLAPIYVGVMLESEIDDDCANDYACVGEMNDADQDSCHLAEYERHSDLNFDDDALRLMKLENKPKTADKLKENKRMLEDLNEVIR
ncbi:hypothetical protein RND71_043714 [Anisodus tanguticus]|uniref:AAA+ ATPase domain-containing protein n=1 Tax=Anisodus tanguticus TaxID=243964 RepID=A0AAE1QRP8_9SOLA|nr:hypothetical protein RND71_043714 [Anisodus tanguticus]